MQELAQETSTSNSRRPIARVFVVAWKTPTMAAFAYSVYWLKTNADARLAQFLGEFPTGEGGVIEIDALDGFIYSDGVL